MKARALVFAVALSLAAGGLAACAGETSSTQQGVVRKPDKEVTPATPKPDQGREATIEQYGVYPLPISVADINKYHLNKQTVKEVAAGKKLAATPTAKMIRKRESHDNYAVRSASGGYHGAYQMSPALWRKYGGSKFASTADGAPAWAQDLVAYRVHKAQGWRPWGG